MAGMSFLSDSGLRKLIYIKKNRPGLSRWTFWTWWGDDTDELMMRGRIIRQSGRWRAQIMGDFCHTSGSVNDACPAWLAGGAVFILGKEWG